METFKPVRDLNDQDLLSEFYSIHRKVESGNLDLVDRRKELSSEISHRFKDDSDPESLETSKIDFSSLIKAVGVGIEYAPLDPFTPAVLNANKISKIAKEYNEEIDRQRKQREMIIKTALAIAGVALKVL